MNTEPTRKDGQPLMLLCLDLEAGSAQLAAAAAAVARRCKAAMHLLYVQPSHGSGDDRGRLEARLRRLVEPALDGAPPAGVTIRRGVPEEVIVAHASEIDARSIVLGRRRRSAVERIYVGSTTAAVLSLARRPVLVIPVSERS